MPRPARSRLSPWIESLIMNYGTEKSGSSSGRLKAHVIGVGQMSQSQAQGSETPTGLLFLSDEVLQIPAVLTAAAWEHLQDQEDRESFASLINTTVCIQDYLLQFHMANEQTKCRFFLLVGELATTAAGPVKDNTACCTTLASVRLKICTTWRVLLRQEAQESQMSQCGFDLSELLGEWRHECMQDILEDVKERLMMVSSHHVSLQPSTSTYTPLLTHSDASTTTSWDVDRVRYKGVKRFSVPIKCLLILEKDSHQLPPAAAVNVGSRTSDVLSAASQDRKSKLPQVCQPSESAQLFVDDADWKIPGAALTETDHNTKEYSCLFGEDGMLYVDTFVGITDSDIRPLSNPWDIFPPPCDTSSSSDVSPEATPTHSLHNPAAAKSGHAVILTSMQLPVHSSVKSHSKEETSCPPRYQKPPHSSSLSGTVGSSASTSLISPELFSRPANVLSATDKLCLDTAQQKVAALEQEKEILEKEPAQSIYKKAKRKRSEPTPEELTILVDEEEEEAQISGSPPSWLFDTQTGFRAEEDCSHQQSQIVGTALRKTATVHSDGRPFLYSYRVSGQNLQDFSQFSVSESWLQWAVKYLVVLKWTDNPQSSLNNLISHENK